MTKLRTDLENAAGKVISAIQKEWAAELGEPCAKESEEVLDRAQEILQAIKAGHVSTLLGQNTIIDFLGVNWIERHQAVKELVVELEKCRGPGWGQALIIG